MNLLLSGLIGFLFGLGVDKMFVWILDYKHMPRLGHSNSLVRFGVLFALIIFSAYVVGLILNAMPTNAATDAIQGRVSLIAFVFGFAFRSLVNRNRIKKENRKQTGTDHE